MRVISGRYRGMVIPMPKKGTIRPTTDRSKEALFSIIQSRYDIQDLKVLDLFTGSASVALEFASRSAKDVVSVELNRSVQQQNMRFAKSKSVEDLRFVVSDVFRFLKKTEDTYDIIFADPPYHLARIKDLPDLVFEYKLLQPNGALIIEHHSSLKWDHPNLVESRAYGQSVFSFFQFDVSLD